MNTAPRTSRSQQKRDYALAQRIAPLIVDTLLQEGGFYNTKTIVALLAAAVLECLYKRHIPNPKSVCAQLFGYYSYRSLSRAIENLS